jgi:hypothetical protein
MPTTHKQTEPTNTLSSDRIVSYVPPQNVAHIWGQVEPLLLKAILYDDFSYDGQNLLDGILKKDMQLWISWKDKVESAVLTQIIDYPKFKVCRWFLAGGSKMKYWIDELTHQVETWAKQNNCKRIELVGRRGWMKKLKDYEAKHIVMTKELL